MSNWISFFKFDIEFAPSLPFLFLANEFLDRSFVNVDEGIIVIEGVYNNFCLGKHFQLLADHPPII